MTPSVVLLSFCLRMGFPTFLFVFLFLFLFLFFFFPSMHLVPRIEIDLGVLPEHSVAGPSSEADLLEIRVHPGGPGTNGLGDELLELSGDVAEARFEADPSEGNGQGLPRLSEAEIAVAGEASLGARVF